MSKKVICDRCGQEVGSGLFRPTLTVHSSYGLNQKEYDLCRDCWKDFIDITEGKEEENGH